MKKILIVDDEVSLLEILKDRFTTAGYKVSTAINGEKGLDQVKKNNPDLILLDLLMPVMDGVSMLAELRKDAKNKTTPVIIFTNLEHNSIIKEKIKNDGYTEYIVKSDIEIEDLVKKVHDILEK